MEEVRRRKYQKEIDATELGEDFRDLEEKDQLQLNKKILKWSNILAQLKEWDRRIPKQVTEGKWIKSPIHSQFDDWEREQAPAGEWRLQKEKQYPVFNADGTPKIVYTINDTTAIRAYLRSVFHTKFLENLPVKKIVNDGKGYSYNRELFKEYGDVLKENVNRAVDIFNAREIELIKKQKEDIKAYQSQEIECGCGGHYSMGNKTKHFATKKHEKWAETQTPIESVAEKADPKDNPQNKEVECGCGGKYSVRNKLKHFATGKHTKWLEANK